MRIIGVVPGAKLFGSEDLYADQYLFVNGYPKRISACGGTPIGILSSDGYVIERALELCDAFVFCGGARFYPYHFEVMDYAARSGKPVLGICLGMQMMNTYFLVAEEAQRRGWSGTLLALFDQMKKERYMFTEPVDGHWNGHITRDSVDSFKHPIRVESGSRIEHLLGGPEILGASMHNYRITHPAAALRVTGRTADGTIEALEYGDLITLEAVIALDNEGVAYRIVWEAFKGMTDESGAPVWEVVDDSDTPFYFFELTEETAAWEYRVSLMPLDAE